MPIEMPLRTLLVSCFFLELLQQIKALVGKAADPAAKAEMVKNQIITDQLHFLNTVWDSKQNTVVAKGEGPSVTEIAEKLTLALPFFQQPSLIPRFHSTRPMSGEYQGKSITFMIEVSLRHSHGNEIFSLLSMMADTTALNSMQGRLRPATLQRAPLVNELQHYLDRTATSQR